MIWNKIASRVTRAGFSFALLVSTLVPATTLLTPAAVHAVACTPTGGGMGAGGLPLLNLKASGSNIDKAALKLSSEITPQAAWSSFDTASSGVMLADASCNTLGTINFFLDATKVLSINYSDSTRSGAFIATTDYTNMFAGTTFSSPFNTNATVNYTLPAVSASVPQLISFDLSNTGWIDAYLKTGTGTDNRLVSFKAPTGFANFLGANTLTYGAYDTGFTSCTQITGSAELLVRSLIDGVAETLTATPTTSGVTCPSYDKTSYNAGTKTASLKYDVAGAAVSHVVNFPGAPGVAAVDILPGGGYTSVLTTLTVDSKNQYFNDYFTSSTSASQQLYIATSGAPAGKAISQTTPYPIAGFIADMTAGDIDFVAKAVTYNVVDSAAKRAAFAHNLNTVSKDGSFTLYVPFQTGDTFVGVCVGASTLDAVSDKCNGVYYLKDGQTKTSSNTKSIPAGRSVKATVITVGAKKFWQVDGLTGSGAFGSTLASDPATGVSLNTTSTAAVAFAVVLTLGLAIAARKMNTSKK